MKVILTFKMPDAIEYAISDYQDWYEEENNECADEDQLEKVREKIEKYVKHGEYISVALDLESGEATVLPAN